jgi:hypothetical protein
MADVIRRRIKDHLKVMEAILQLSPEVLHASCLSCDHFREDNENCQLANVRPPARVIAFGCESWENIDEDIPY